MNTSNPTSNEAAVRDYLQALQTTICDTLAAIDGKAHFEKDPWVRAEGGGGTSAILSGGTIFEKAGVGFSEVNGTQLPPSATAQRPELAGRTWRAMGVSLVLHPNNPHIPTSHMNVRFFVAEKENEAPVWWFGGGFDLTPYYAYEEDCISWHQTAKDACDPFGEALYTQCKKKCDEYFYLKHRGETRGIGGIFFDDFNGEGFEHAFGFTQSVGNAFLKAYVPIVEKRRQLSYTDEQKKFQLYRRGRYVEFNLVYDRGTLFGLQSGGRTESILMSMPPQASWEYNYTPEPGTVEAAFYERYLKPQNWLA